MSQSNESNLQIVEEHNDEQIKEDLIKLGKLKMRVNEIDGGCQ
jgi:hypothetical protein